MGVKETTYRNHPLLEFHSGDECADQYPVSLGVKKIKFVLDNLETCKAFVAKHTAKEE